jgi:hypothetical protein
MLCLTSIHLIYTCSKLLYTTTSKIYKFYENSPTNEVEAYYNINKVSKLLMQSRDLDIPKFMYIIYVDGGMLRRRMIL